MPKEQVGPQISLLISVDSDRRLPIHPDYQTLLDRYATDSRFAENEPARHECLRYLVELNEWVQTVNKPLEIQAIILTGSFSHLEEKPPDLKPVIAGPRWRAIRPGGSDIDLLFLYSSNAKDLLRLKWYDFNIPEREMAHPKDFVVNTRNYFQKELRSFGKESLTERVEIHVAVLTSIFGEAALKKYVKYMIRTGTVIWGSLPLSIYGTHRDKPLNFKRPLTDSILDQMGGGF